MKMEAAYPALVPAGLGSHNGAHAAPPPPQERFLPRPSLTYHSMSNVECGTLLFGRGISK